MNDDFRVRPNLTLNLGLRYEYVTVPVASRAQQFSSIANVPGVITFANPKVSKNDWSPRFGFAYSPGKDQKWVVRGGVGRSFDLPYANLSVNANPAVLSSHAGRELDRPSQQLPGQRRPDLRLPLRLQATASARQSLPPTPGIRTVPTLSTARLGVQRLLGKDYTIEARYVYTKGVHLYVQDRLNIVPQVTPNNFIPTFLSMRLPPVTFAGLAKTLGTHYHSGLPSKVPSCRGNR